MVNIINEEIVNFLNESMVFENENFKFRDEIRKPSFYNYAGFSNDYDVNIDVDESNLYINWHIGFWLNEFGIENFIINIDSIEGTYKLKYLDKQTDEISQETDKNIAEVKWIFEVAGGSLRPNGSLYVDTVTFDFATKKCNITYTGNV